MIVFSCPTCRFAMQVPPTMAGQPVTCPSCHNGVLVPPAPPPPPPEPLSLDDPEEEAAAAAAEAEQEAERERRLKARTAAREAKQRQTSMLYLIFGPLCALLAGGLLIGLIPTITRDINGARKITSADLARFDPAKSASPWVEYEAKDIIMTDVGIETKRRRGASNRTRFAVVPVEDKWLIVQCDSDQKGKRLEGKMTTFDTGLEKEAMDKVQALHPDKKGKWLAYQMDASQGSATLGPIIMLVGMSILLLLGLGGTLYGFISRPRARPRR